MATTLPILFQRQAAAKAEDLHQNGIDIELMSMNRHSHTFDDDQFYKDILFTDDDENTVRPDPADKFDELMSKYVRCRSNVIKMYKKHGWPRFYTVSQIQLFVWAPVFSHILWTLFL